MNESYNTVVHGKNRAAQSMVLSIFTATAIPLYGVCLHNCTANLNEFWLQSLYHHYTFLNSIKVHPSFLIASRYTPNIL